MYNRFWAICFAKHFALLQFFLCGDVHCLLPRGKRKELHTGERLFSPEYDPWFGRGVFYRVKLFITSITCAMSSSLSALPLGRHRLNTSYFLKMIAKKVWKMRLRSLPKLQVAIYSKLHCSLSGIMYWI